MKCIQMQSTIQTCLNKQFLLVAISIIQCPQNAQTYETNVYRQRMKWTHDMRGLMHSQPENSARAFSWNILHHFFFSSFYLFIFCYFVDVKQSIFYRFRSFGNKNFLLRLKCPFIKSNTRNKLLHACVFE